jgi:hypothetical protein
MHGLLNFILAAILAPFVLVAVGVPMLLFAGISFPYGLVVNYGIRRRERHLLERLRSAGRFLAWPEVAEKLSRGEGTLILEQANKDGSRFWWTPDDVASLAPLAPPEVGEMTYFLRDDSHPFVAWCRSRYTSPAHGTALVTAPHRVSFPPGFIEPDYLKKLFPEARVVPSVLVSKAE